MSPLSVATIAQALFLPCFADHSGARPALIFKPDRILVITSFSASTARLHARRSSLRNSVAVNPA
ncbi:exported hypothetical protein [Agrobacterium genomosp. 2 str. CFBP 5494]|uniref:Uncharacterized protein n=1 Tax=Agrobacterium genomosp. 2 str. CFBP 5494 TaxID=1183436 RepID=A0A9W5F2D1_9HYPH|nr:exported hypothetical protein [Agrobacterium genomosp. 2 str. CFBP 5494]